MQIKSAEFVVSNSSVFECPRDNIPEHAFIGRSNVGKSSLINMLMGRNDLAKISNTPGKTRLINHFRMNKNWFLVDFPGYGYARVSKSERSGFQKMIVEYFKNRKQLVATFLLVDSRHEPQKIDLDFMVFLAENKIPFVIVFTKVDKLKFNIQEKIAHYKEKMLKENWMNFPTYFVSSSLKKEGRKVLLSFIESVNEFFFKNQNEIE